MDSAPRKQRLFDWLEDPQSGSSIPEFPAADECAAGDQPQIEESSCEHEGLLRAAQSDLAEDPTDPILLLSVALAALLEEQPDLCLRYQHRFSKRYPAIAFEDQLLRTVALAQQGRWAQAEQVIKQYSSESLLFSVWYLPHEDSLLPWFRRWFKTIEIERRKQVGALRAKTAAPRARKKSHARGAPTVKESEPAPSTSTSNELPEFDLAVPVSITFRDPSS